MASTDLQIVLKLLDEASADIKKATSALAKDEEELEKLRKKNEQDEEKRRKKQKNALQQASTALRQFRSQLLVVSVAITAISLASAEWAERNDEVRSSLDEIGLAFKNALAAAGKRVAPIANFFGDIARKFNKEVGEEVNDEFERASIAVKNFDEDIKKLNISFQAGLMPAKEYFQALMGNANDPMSIAKQGQQGLQELANATALAGNKELMDVRRRTEEQISLMNEVYENHKIAHQGMAALTVTLSQSIRTNLTSALTGIITGALTAKEAFAQLGQMMIQTIVEFMVQKLVAWALEKTLLATTTAATIGAAGVIAAAWGPAAFLATVATLGGAALQAPAALGAAGVASAAAMTGVGAAFKAVSVSSKMSGGGKELASSGGFAVGTPSVPNDMIAQIHKGETIVPATFADAIRRGELSLSGRGGGNGTIININYPQFRNTEDMEELSNMIALKIERELRYTSG